VKPLHKRIFRSYVKNILQYINNFISSI